MAKSACAGARGGTPLTMPVGAGNQPSHASAPLAVAPRVRPLLAARGPRGSAAGATADAVHDHGAGHRPRPHGSLARCRLRRVAWKGREPGTGVSCSSRPAPRAREVEMMRGIVLLVRVSFCALSL